jgi:putative copper resistance protein D
MDAFIVGARLVHFSAAMLLFGASLFRIYVAHKIPRDIAVTLDPWLWKTLLAASILASLSALAWWDALAIYMGDGWRDALNSDVLSAVLFETEFGKVWIWHLGFCFAAAAILLISPASFPKVNGLVAVCALALLITLAAVGHATMHEGVPRIVHQSAQTIHLVAAGSWLGALAPLGYALWHAARERRWLSLALSALSRFSRLGYFAIGLILFSGCVMSWQMVGGWSELFDTAYGRVLLAKIFLFSLMTGVAAVNRFYWMPRLAPGKNAKRSQPMLRSLLRNVILEQAIGLAILSAASLLGTLPPAHIHTG